MVGGMAHSGRAQTARRSQKKGGLLAAGKNQDAEPPDAAAPTEEPELPELLELLDEPAEPDFASAVEPEVAALFSEVFPEVFVVEVGVELALFFPYSLTYHPPPLSTKVVLETIRCDRPPQTGHAASSTS